MAGDAPLNAAEVLALIPQQRPFRFIDELLAIDEHSAVGRYTFRSDEDFYRGHFPDKPITPGVILLESMAQTGVVALGIYLKSLEIPRDEVPRWRAIFTDGTVEFFDMVPPGERVTNRATRVFWRRNKLRSKVEMTAGDGRLVARCEIAGVGVRSE